MLYTQIKQSGKQEKLGILQVFQGVIAAMFGVRDHPKHKTDFEEGDLAQFVAVGVFFVAVFIFTLYWLVKAILSQYV